MLLIWSLIESGVGQLECVCVCVCVCSLLKNDGPKIDYAHRHFSMFTSLQIVSISTHVLAMHTYVSETTTLRQNWSSGRCNVSWLHNQQFSLRRKRISGCRVEGNAAENRISTVRFTTHLNTLQVTYTTFTKSYLYIYPWVFMCGKNIS